MRSLPGMADVIPFACVRPTEELVGEVAALPYDVYNLEEARQEIQKHPHSFLRIDMPEATLPDTVEPHSSEVYDQAKKLLNEAIDDGTYIVDECPRYYFYRLSTEDGRSQTGVVGCSSIDDYLNGAIKKHEKTRADKEVDRIRHVDTCSAQTGPIFLAYRSEGTIESIMEAYANKKPLFDFQADDKVRHTVWRIDDAIDSKKIRVALQKTSALYIADGHHRAASAVKTGVLRREQAEKEGKAGQALESDHFLSVIFPSEQLNILDYNRVVADLNGYSKEEFLKKVSESFIVSQPSAEQLKPSKKGTFGMFLDGFWYGLAIKDALMSDDPVKGLDVSLLQDNLLKPILGIEDPRTNNRIDFVGGIRGLSELERRVQDGMAVAFALYPTSIEELFDVADANLLMPPKSTWFEPKLRSGIFIHRI